KCWVYCITRRGTSKAPLANPPRFCYAEGARKPSAREAFMRLQKYLAQCGVASRRAAERLIAEGHVTVDGEAVRQMGVQVEPGQDVRVDGRPVRPEAEKRYIMYHKPAGE